MGFKIVLALCVMVAVASALPGAAGPWGAWGAAGAAPAAPAVNPWLPPWIATAPWMPVWSPCTTIGSSCVDCNTKQVCTKVGGIQRACTDPTMPYCNLGECSATPTDACAVPAAPASVAA